MAHMNFKDMRHKMGYTLTDVSKVYGIPYSTLQKWEYGISEPPEYVLRMMVDLYMINKESFDSLLV